jgi:biotin carboxylase
MGIDKILVLGTGNAQVDFIRFCKSKGLEVHSCSYKPEGKGIKYSDYFNVINILDEAAIEAYAKINDINLIYSTGSDMAMPAVMAVSKRLNLPFFVSPEIARICNNKTLLRQRLAKLPDYNVHSKILSCPEDVNNWSIFPAIVKPADSQGQRGVQEVASKADLTEAFHKAIKHSNTNTAILEEYVDGFEISINLYVIEGEIKLLFISRRESFDEYPGGIIKSHSYPVTEKFDSARLKEMSSKVIKELEITNGPVYFQVKINRMGIPKVIEVTPRLDGCHMWRFIKELNGINLFDIILTHLITGSVDDRLFHAQQDYLKPARLSFFTSKPNTKFHRSQFKEHDNAIYREWYYDNDEIIRPINGYADKVGYQIIFSGK